MTTVPPQENVFSHFSSGTLEANRKLRGLKKILEWTILREKLKEVKNIIGQIWAIFYGGTNQKECWAEFEIDSKCFFSDTWKQLNYFHWTSLSLCTYEVWWSRTHINVYHELTITMFLLVWLFLKNQKTLISMLNFSFSLQIVLRAAFF